MGFSRTYFAIVTKTERFEHGKPHALHAYKNAWTIRQGRDLFDDVGDVVLFEREEAARRLLEFKKEWSAEHDGSTAMQFVRAITRTGAAKKALDDQGEFIESFRP